VLSQRRKKAPGPTGPATEGFVVIVDGHFKSELPTIEAAEVSGRNSFFSMSRTYPMITNRNPELQKKFELYWSQQD